MPRCFVDRQEPQVLVPPIGLPRVVLPRLVIGVARLRDQVEGPEQRAGARVPGADDTAGRRRDQDVLVDRRRRLHRRAHLDEAALAELEPSFPGLRVEREQSRAATRRESRGERLGVARANSRGRDAWRRSSRTSRAASRSTGSSAKTPFCADRYITPSITSGVLSKKPDLSPVLNVQARSQRAGRCSVLI